MSLAAYASVACSKRSDSGERCGVEKAMKSRGGLGREVLTQARLTSSKYSPVIISSLFERVTNETPKDVCGEAMSSSTPT